ncbi:carbohydrate ABC transporter permease [Alicyclobacillus sacchari]|uniref:carbohydrate ABC transporter permease n=1 Tax=Alicyclobacillus sacchari TaxID=392010 RepID=UPI001065B9B7|nr:carbohydrate ABC transporter permease [Alicyclobacillus sacchari]
MRKLPKRSTKGDMVFDIVNLGLLLIVCLIVLYPLYFVLIASFSDPTQVNLGHVWLWTRHFTLEGYKVLFATGSIWRGFVNSLLYCALSVAISVPLTIMAAYPLSRKDFVGRHVITVILTVTLLFSGGLIPTYMLVRSLGMVNTIWALILPGAVGAWNIIVARTFFQTSIPNELLEAAKMDGCSDIRFLIQIVIPLSKPMIAVMTLWVVVGQWNSYFPAMIYLNNTSLYPLQLVLYQILVQNQSSIGITSSPESMAAQQHLAELIQYTAIIVSTIPLLVLYPFLQKYFVKGVTVGSLKG